MFKKPFKICGEMRGMYAEMIKESWKESLKEYNSLFEKQKCPVCGEQCIDKENLSNFLCDHICPNYKATLRLTGRVHTVWTVTWLILITYALSLCVLIRIPGIYLPYICDKILLVSLPLYHLIRGYVFLPYSKIERYDSTPMDDLIINAKKFKKFIKKLFSKKTK